MQTLVVTTNLHGTQKFLLEKKESTCCINFSFQTFSFRHATLSTYFIFLNSVLRFVKEKLERMPGDVAFMVAASSPTDCGAGTGSMMGRGASSVDVNKYNAKCQTSKKTKANELCSGPCCLIKVTLDIQDCKDLY